MKEGMFRIGEAAEICGMTAKALRFYERAGLAAPAFVDPENGYRYYSGEGLVRLDVVGAARAMGLAIAEIKALFEARSGEELIERIEAQEKRALARMKELKRALVSFASIRTALADCLRPSGGRGVVVKEIPERLILSTAIGADPTIEEVAAASAALEAAVRRRGLTNRYESGILLAQAGGSAFLPSAAFVVVEAEEPRDASGLTSLPAGSYACVRYGEADAARRQAELGAFMRRRKLEPVLILQAELASAAFSIGEDKAELQVLARPASRRAHKSPAGSTRPRR